MKKKESATEVNTQSPATLVFERELGCPEFTMEHIFLKASGMNINEALKGMQYLLEVERKFTQSRKQDVG